MRKGLEELEKQIKVLQVEMLNGLSNNQKMSQESDHLEKDDKKRDERSKSPAANGREENTINWKNQLNDRISKIQASLQGLVTETEFNRFKQQTRDRTEEM